MDIQGTSRIPASLEMVWAALNDPVVLAQCVDGCDSFEQVDPAQFAATGSIRVGPVRSRIAINLTITEKEPPTRAVLRLTARGSLGRAEAVATIHLTATDEGTNLDYQAHAVFGGQLGRFATRWADGAAQELLDTFFARFVAAIPAETPIVGKPASPSILRPAPVVAAPRTKAVWIGIGAAAGATVTAAVALLLCRNRRS